MKRSRFTTRMATGVAVLTVAMSAGLVFAPSAFAAPAAGPANPNTGLHDGDGTVISGTGFTGNTTIQIVQCQGTAASPPADGSVCDGNTLDASTTSDATGNFTTVGHKVYELHSAASGTIFPTSTINCDANNPCVEWAGEDFVNGFSSSKHAFVDISFATYGNGPLLRANVQNPVGPGPFAGAPTAFPNGASVPVNVLTNAKAFDSLGAVEPIVTAGPYVTSSPTNGTVTVDTSGVAHYTPNATFNPTTATKDSFTVAGTATFGGNPVTGPPVNQAPITFTVNLGHGNNPTLVAKSASVTNAAGSVTTFKTTNATPNGVLDGAVAKDSTGANETLIGVAVTGAPPAFGAVTGPTGANNDFTYTLNTPNTAPANGGTDTFTITATYAVAGTTTPTFSASQPETVTIAPSFASSCDATTGAAATPPVPCKLTQQITVPVTGADLTMSQSVGLPIDLLNHTPVGAACTGPAIILSGQPQVACGAMAPITVDNARGTASTWSLTGVVSNDFLTTTAATVTPVVTCDTVATYRRDCIPGGNLGWSPTAAVAHGLVPGDVAAVNIGDTINPPGVIAPTTNPNNLAALGNNASNTPPVTGGGFSYQPSTIGAVVTTGPEALSKPSNEPSPPGGLHNSAQPLCDAAATTSGGTFVCGATLSLAVPASAAADTAGYTAQLVLTLS